MTSAGPQLLPVREQHDVPFAYRDTAIADLLAYHNLGVPHRHHTQAELLVGTCMDNRQQLRIPKIFAFVMRAAGADFRGMEFQMSFAIGVGGVRAIALIGHDQCGMSRLATKRDALVAGLVDGAGWERHLAERHFEEHAPRFEIGDPVEFTRGQAHDLRQQFPKLTVAPLLYRLADEMLYVIDDGSEGESRSP